MASMSMESITGWIWNSSRMTLDLLSTLSTGEILEGYFKNVNPQDVPLLSIPQIEPLAQNIKEVFSPRHQLQNGKRVIRS